MEPSRELDDELFRQKVRQARAMTPEQKLPAGPRLFDYACRITMCGIRAQFPDANEKRVREILKERLALGRRLEKMH